jgi:hypothetical protein
MQYAIAIRNKMQEDFEDLFLRRFFSWLFHWILTAGIV